MKQEKYISTRVDKLLYAKIEKLAKKEERKIGDVVRRLLKKALKC